MTDLPTTLPKALQAGRCLFNLQQVESAIVSLAETVNTAYDSTEKYTQASSPSDPVIVLTVMNGGMIFSGMLMPRLTFLVELDYIHATRYAHNKTGGELALLSEPRTDLQNKRVLLVDDIFDDGVTLQKVAKYCTDRGARDVKSAVLVYKEKSRKDESVSMPDFTALNVPNEFVFGMGMDANGLFRNAPGIYYFAH